MDPTNLFIGTSMDGVDIRGQDLRGIRFTHLDLAKVQHDAATLLDGRDALAPDTARVLLAIPRVDQRSIARVIGDRAAFTPWGQRNRFSMRSTASGRPSSSQPPTRCALPGKSWTRRAGEAASRW